MAAHTDTYLLQICHVCSRKMSIYLTLALVFQVIHVHAIPEDPLMTYDQWYSAGTAAYTKEKWVSDCVRRCKKRVFEERPDGTASKEVEEAFESLKPYDYLQLCYYKIDNLEQAIATAYTFLLGNPEHEPMRRNIEYYRKMPGVKLDWFKDIELKTYQAYYLQALDHYKKDEWLMVLENMEKALQNYYKEHEQCAALCEEKYDHESFPEFYNAISDHYISVLKCKMNCPVKMGRVYGKPNKHYLADHFHYLQFAYYKVGNIEKAAQAVASFLLLKPDDDTQFRNKIYYLTQESISETHFTPRQDLMKFHLEQTQMSQLLRYAEKHYISADSEMEEKDYPEEVPPRNRGVNPEDLIKTYPVDPEGIKEYEGHGVKIIGDEVLLNGTERFAADGILTEDQCNTLIELAQKATIGDGYKSLNKPGTSPHTSHEIFAGLDVTKASELAQNADVDPEWVQLYLDVADKARDLARKYFVGDKPLYFDFTHLVCRTALEGGINREDLSHPIHGDNCLLLPDGTCKKERPAYVQRDYSALVYLNGDFEGGNFMFNYPNKTIQSEVKPKCGRIVSFNASNLHGVQPVIKGKRCAVALWFTLDSNYREAAHIIARSMLKSISKKPTGPKVISHTEL
ncbi:unnamed protein product [Owenia fusiformis]|uniref:procollagen-proline 3-dioxygenase n=1 Tax=Owenia fusiformis TaxID=6347 RepID=A0A8S4NXI2_OWEFU|nr:unnamed protein product [Owenia fusiformis]